MFFQQNNARVHMELLFQRVLGKKFIENGSYKYSKPPCHIVKKSVRTQLFVLDAHVTAPASGAVNIYWHSSNWNEPTKRITEKPTRATTYGTL